jgi:WXG100 family type VII secretion target
MSSEKIEANYEVLGNVIKLFSARCDQLAKLTSDVQAASERLSCEGWIGTGSDAFEKEMKGTVLPSMKRLAEAMCAASQATRKISDTLSAAEEQACGCFRF